MGGSSSRQVQETTLPDWYEDAAQEAIKRSREIYEVGRLPYTGIDVAGINPAEAAAARNVASMASAFGLEAPAELDMGGMPTVTTGGMTGYSSYPMFTADMQRLKEQRPDQYEYFARMTGFDPITGAATQPLTPPAPVAPVSAAPRMRSDVQAFLDSQAKYRDEGSRMSTGRGSGPTGSAPLRPLLRPDSRVGLSGLEQNIREGISSAVNNSPTMKLFSALTNRA